MNVLDEKLLREFVDWLEQAYYKPDSGTWDNGDEQDYLNSTFDFGNSYQLALTVLGAIRETGRWAEVVGAEAEKGYPPGSPGSHIGLDWVLVDNSVIVDLWSYGNVDRKWKIVLDLNNPQDAEEISKRFPPRDQWSRCKVTAENIKFYNGIWSNFILPRDVVGKLLEPE